MSDIKISNVNVRAVVTDAGLVFGEISDIQFELRRLQKQIDESGEQMTPAEVIFFINQILDEVIVSGRELKRQKEFEAQKAQAEKESSLVFDGDKPK